MADALKYLYIQILVIYEITLISAYVQISCEIKDYN